MDKLLTPHPPNPASEPVGTLERAGRALKILDEQIRSKGVEMGRLGVQFSQAKQELQKQRAGILKDEDAALEALRRDGRSDTAANMNANSDAPRKFTSEFLPPNLKEKTANYPVLPLLGSLDFRG